MLYDLIPRDEPVRLSHLSSGKLKPCAWLEGQVEEEFLRCVYRGMVRACWLSGELLSTHDMKCGIRGSAG